MGVVVVDVVFEVCEVVDYVIKLGGGKGVICEFVEIVFKVKKCWNDVVCKYYLFWVVLRL